MGERAVRVGVIDYANAWPIFTQPDESHTVALSLPGQIHPAIPSRLNQMMHHGELDVAAMAAFAYAERASDYLLLPNLSISSRGAVHSIMLFSKKPLAKLADGGTIALSHASATSVHLLKLYLARTYIGSPNYVTMNASLAEMLAIADAALLIGDPAIRASWNVPPDVSVHDIGQLWYDWSGTGMTYAVVAVRREFASREPALVSELWHRLRHNVELHKADRSQALISRAIDSLGGNREYWAMYFQALHHDFGELEQHGLHLYLRYAHEQGFLERQPSLEWFNPISIRK